jgi:hypothetical protein
VVDPYGWIGCTYRLSPRRDGDISMALGATSPAASTSGNAGVADIGPSSFKSIPNGPNEGKADVP